VKVQAEAINYAIQFLGNDVEAFNYNSASHNVELAAAIIKNSEHKHRIVCCSIVSNKFAVQTNQVSQQYHVAISIYFN